mgnify:CR=1 FL=1
MDSGGCDAGLRQKLFLTREIIVQSRGSALSFGFADMGVDILGSGYGGVTKDRLGCCLINTSIVQHGGVGMAELMGGHVRFIIFVIMRFVIM